MSIEESTSSQLIRRVKCVRGSMHIRVVCAPRFDYARTNHRLEQHYDQECTFVPDDPDITGLRLLSSTPLKVQEGMITAEFSIQCGESVPFVLEAASPKHKTSVPSREEIAKAFKDTLNFWRQWEKNPTIPDAGAIQSIVRLSC